MVVTRQLVARLEAVEAEVVARDLARRGDGEHAPWRGGVLTALAGSHLHNRAYAATLGELDDDDVDELLAWFDARGVTAHVQLSAWAPDATVAALARAGLVPKWVRSVHAIATDAVRPPVDHGLDVRVVDDELLEVATTVLLEGLRGRPDTVTDSDRTRAAVEAADDHVRGWLASRDGRPIAAGLAHEVDGTVFLGPAATLTGERRRGAQQALLAARLAWAASIGADIAFVTSRVDSATARNAERLGLRLVQQQIVLRGPSPP